ncbi:hypothetical protein [Streptomyces sp. NPDC058583]|uniref:hypothetical protein n=1 Tax=unclassified Streptomyces TaxID=2593676 RepID=UPI00364A5B25
MAVTFQAETVDSSSVQGQLTLLVTKTGIPHVVYTSPAGRIRYAHKGGGGWVQEELPPGAETTGGDDRVCIVLDSHEKPHVAFRDRQNDHLVYGVKNGTWKFEEVPTQGGIHPRGAQHISLRLHPGRFDSGLRDTPHLSYHDLFHPRLAYVAKTPEDGRLTWKGHVEEVDYPGDPHDAGLHSSLVFDADETIGIAYFDDRADTYQRPKLAMRGDFEWAKELLDGTTARGEFASMVPGLVGRDAIGYYDVENKQIAVWIRDRAEPPARREVVARDVPRGAKPSLAATPTHALRVAYVDAGGLRVALRSANDTWDVTTLDTATTAAWPSLAYDQTGAAHIAWVSGGTLKYARGTE